MMTYIIGRSETCDIVFDEPTVSRTHAEFVIAENGTLYLTDCNSSLGTRVARDGAWKEIRQSFVDRNDTVLLGRHEISIVGILSRISNIASKPQHQTPKGKLSRNRESGQPESRGN